ncbi:MAG TPA: HDIG domain-containing protein [Firmicutes bacterium]|nr:HDIG domain-containing protein [Bacillota bacterium]
MMSREEAFALLKKHLQTKNLMKHCLAVEGAMSALARELNGDEKRWALAGLLHDIDYDKTMDHPERHGFEGEEILRREADVDEEVIYAIKAHPGALPRKSLMDKALYASDPLTGLIVAAALLHPEKKLSALDTDFVLRRFYEKSFARGAHRDVIQSCESFMPLEKFIAVVLGGMKEISSELGL